MVKKTITIAIDVDTYLKIQTLKAAGREINISQICNDTLKGIVKIKEKGEKQTELIEKEIKELENKVLLAKAEYLEASNKEAKEQAETLEKAKSMNKAIRNSGVLDFD